MPPIAPADLPFLVAHGGLVWKVLLVLLVALVFAGVILFRRVRARRAARAAAIASARRIGKIGDGDAVLQVVVRGGAASTLSIRDARYNHRDDAVVLECAGETIAIDDEIEILLGSEEHTRWRGVPRATPAPLRAVAPSAPEPTMLRFVRAGDEVVVEGRVRRAATAETGAGYREGAGGWAIAGRDGWPVRIRALRPAGAPPPLTIGLVATTALLAGFLGFVVMWRIGAAMLERTDTGRDRRPPVDELNAFTLAAAMPLSRDKALEHLDYQYNRPTSDAELAIEVAVADLDGGCAAAASAYLDADHFEQAAATAQGCGATSIVVDAELALGHYDRAAAALPATGKLLWPSRDGLVFLGAGRWADAARAADAMAAAFAEPTGFGDADGARIRENLRQKYECFAAQLRVWAGDASSRKTVVAIASKGGLPCRVLEAATRPPAERATALLPLAVTDNNDGYAEYQARELAEALLWIEGDGREVEHSPLSRWDVARAISEAEPGLQVWFAPFAMVAFAAPIAAGSTDPAVRAGARSALLWNAALDVWRGRIDAAIAGVRSVEPLLESDGRYGLDKEGLAVILNAIRMHTMATDLVAGDKHMEGDVVLRSGAMPPEPDRLIMGSYPPERCEPAMLAAVVAAQAGDGRPLVAVMHECELYWIRMQTTLIAVLPRVTRGRAELAEALRYFTHNSSGDTPFELLVTALVHRSHLQLTGDDRGARWWQELIDRHLAVLADRDRLIALALWKP